MPLASVVARSSGLRVSTAGAVSVAVLGAGDGGGDGLGGAAGLGLCGRLWRGAEVEVLGDAVLELVGVAGEVDVVEAQDAEEVVDAVDVAVGDVGLDGVADSRRRRCAASARGR